MRKSNFDYKKSMNRNHKRNYKKTSAIVAAAFFATTSVIPPANANALTSEPTPVQPFASSVYDEEVDHKYIKYGRIEVRDHNVNSNVVNLTYYTHYSLNMLTRLKNATFNFTIDEDLKDHILDVKVKTKRNNWISARELNDGTYAINHSDVLRTGLIGVNQQFDIQIVLNDEVQNLDKERYTADIALLDRKNRVVTNTVNNTYIETADEEMIREDNNLITGSGYDIESYDPNDTELTLNYVMHYKLNAAKHKDGQFVFTLDEKLLPYISEVLIETRDGKFKPVTYDGNGKFSYATKSLVSHSLIGIRQNF